MKKIFLLLFTVLSLSLSSYSQDVPLPGTLLTKSQVLSLPKQSRDSILSLSVLHKSLNTSYNLSEAGNQVNIISNKKIINYSLIGLSTLLTLQNVLNKGQSPTTTKVNNLIIVSSICAVIIIDISSISNYKKLSKHLINTSYNF